jgi:hypothetical protein
MPSASSRKVRDDDQELAELLRLEAVELNA